MTAATASPAVGARNPWARARARTVSSLIVRWKAGDAARVAGPGVVGDRAARHGQVADLTGGPGRTAVQPSTEDDGETDTAADPDQHEVVDVAGRADARLCDRGEVHVVLERDRSVEVGPQRAEEAVVPAGQVEGERDVAAGRVDQTRRAEHDPAHPFPWRAGAAPRPR